VTMRIPHELPEASPVILSESATHIVVAISIAKTTLAQHERFLTMLLQASTPSPTVDEE
jgi:hypothetical protein